MKVNSVFGRVLCMVLSLMGLMLPVMSAAAAEVAFSEICPAATVRYGRSADSLVIGYLEDGAELKIIDDSQQAVYKIDCHGMKGYISKENVREIEGHYYTSCLMEDEKTRLFVPMQESRAEQLRQALYDTAQSLLGTRYRWGGTTPKGFDCSGFIRYVFEKNGIELQRTSQQQISDGIIIDKEDLQCGDLVFFGGTHDSAVVTHVGMYIGDGCMIHAASKGVRIDSLDSKYYSQRYLGARRIVLSIPDKKEACTFRVNTDSEGVVARMATAEPERFAYVRDIVAIFDKHDIIKLIMLLPEDGIPA